MILHLEEGIIRLDFFWAMGFI